MPNFKLEPDGGRHGESGSGWRESVGDVRAIRGERTYVVALLSALARIELLRAVPDLVTAPAFATDLKRSDTVIGSADSSEAGRERGKVSDR
jgi:hypothetical protein